MSLRDYVARIDLAYARAPSVEALARAVRDALPLYLADPGFRLDCAERVLQRGVLDAAEWANPPIHVDRRRSYRLRVFFWMPEYFVPPHQHNTWGVTGVLHGEARVRLYRREAAAGLALEREFQSRAGEAGYLLPPCTHSVGNPGKSVCATFHVFSVSPKEAQRRNDTLWYPAPPGAAPEDPRRAALLGLAQMLAAIKGPRAAGLLQRLHDHALL